MSDAHAISALGEAIAAVAESPGMMRDLADAAGRHRHCEREWVALLVQAPALQSADVRTEVRLTGNGRADLAIGATLVEFKSTKAANARPGYFWAATSPYSDSAESWFSKDIARSYAVDGLFVLLITTAGPVDRDNYVGLTAEQVRELAVQWYIDGLLELAARDRSPANVDRIYAGRDSGEGGSEVVHDALIVSWPSL